MMPEAADTINYMVAGYVVIFGVMLTYLVSLVARWRRAHRDKAMLEELADSDAP
jgi:preprotein translocase subunit Sec63